MLLQLVTDTPLTGSATETLAQANALPASIDDFLASVEQKAYRMAFFKLQHEQKALDVVQDSMMKLVEKYSDRPSKEWPSLFFTIVRNRITDSFRRYQVREAGGKLVSIFKTRPDSEGDLDMLEIGMGVDAEHQLEQPDRQLYDGQLKQLIGDAVLTLSERQRQVFTLREAQGYSVRETALALGCSEGSVKQHHFRALRALRQSLAEVWDHD